MVSINERKYIKLFNIKSELLHLSASNVAIFKDTTYKDQIQLQYRMKLKDYQNQSNHMPDHAKSEETYYRK